MKTIYEVGDTIQALFDVNDSEENVWFEGKVIEDTKLRTWETKLLITAIFVNKVQVDKYEDYKVNCGITVKEENILSGME